MSDRKSEQKVSMIFLNSVFNQGVLITAVFFGFYFMARRRKRLQQRFFAWMLSKLNTQQLSKCLLPYKQELFSTLNDIVSSDQGLAQQGSGCLRLLEIGIGTGVNLEFYPSGTHLVSIEPNPFFERHFKENQSKFSQITVENFVKGTAEDMSDIPDNAIDVVVSTHVLCSVENVERCLSEIFRVLIPGGKFYYVEHVSYNESRFWHRLQIIIEPFWKLFNDDCRLNIETSNFIKNIFDKVDEKRIIVRELPIPIMRPHIFGVATK